MRRAASATAAIRVRTAAGHGGVLRLPASLASSRICPAASWASLSSMASSHPGGAGCVVVVVRGVMVTHRGCPQKLDLPVLRNVPGKYSLRPCPARAGRLDCSPAKS